MSAVRKVATIVAIDAAGYSRQSETDEPLAVREIKALRRRIEDGAGAHGGRVFSTSGDGFMLEFAAPSASIAFIDELFANSRIPLRAGAHIGEIWLGESGDLLGHGVNVAARLQALASPGELVVSLDLRKAVGEPYALRLKDRGSVKLDKMSTRMDIATLESPWRVHSDFLSRWRKASITSRRAAAAAVAVLLACLAGFVFWAGTRPTRYSIDNVHLIANSARPELYPALSPDGRFLVYAAVPEDDANGATDLYLQSIQGGEPIRLTDTPEIEGASAWSPAGDRVAFVRMGADQASRTPCRLLVRLVPQGQEREVARCDVAFFTGRLSWSPDGASIIFSDFRQDADISYLRIVDVVTGASRELVPGGLPGSNYNAAFGPNGRRIAFMNTPAFGGPAAANNAYAYEFGSRSLTQLTQDGVRGFLDWAPDGRSLLLAIQREGAFGLWQAPLDNSRPMRRLGLDLQSLGRVSQAGGYVAFETSTSIDNLVRISGAGSQAVSSGSQSDYDPAIASDGAIAFFSYQAGYWLYLQRVGQPPARLMKIELGSPRYLRWSPNNRDLVFSAARGDSGHLYVVNTVSGHIEELETPGLSPREADWSSDGRSLLFSASESGNVRLWRMSLASPAAPQPASPIGWSGALQQDEVLLAGRRFEDGVWRLNTDGRSILLTPEVQSAGRIPAWTVWRDRLYYIYMPSGADSHLPTSGDGYLYSRPIAGGAATRIAELPSLNIDSGIAVDPRNGDVVYSRRVSLTQDIGLASLHAQ